MAAQTIKITGARQHNLKNLTLEIPRERLVVITGMSGSGKSSLAFDTLYAEGQRRYVESLSAYARQFLDQMEKPDVDFIEGLSPAIAIEQRSSGGNPRSTIATTTEIYDYLRLLYSSVGVPHDPVTGARISKLSAQQIVDRVLELPMDSRIVLLAPIIHGEVGEFRDVLEKLKREGFVRARVDGAMVELTGQEPLVKLPRGREHVIEAVIDRLVIKEGLRQRLADSVDTALRWGGNKLTVLVRVEAGAPRETAHRAVATTESVGEEQWEERKYSTDFTNPETGFTLPQLTPKHFSFNSHLGACPACHGLGTQLVVDPELIVADPEKTLTQGAIAPWANAGKRLEKYYSTVLKALAAEYRVSMDLPWSSMPEEFQRALIFGTGERAVAIPLGEDGRARSTPKPFEGIVAQLERLHENAEGESVRQRVRQFMGRHTCPVCHGARLKPEILAVTVSTPERALSGNDALERAARTARGAHAPRVPDSAPSPNPVVPGTSFGEFHSQRVGDALPGEGAGQNTRGACAPRANAASGSDATAPCRLSIYGFCQLTIAQAQRFIAELELTEQQQFIVTEVRREVSNRLNFLVEVGLGYLNLNRESGTLSGGEAQRIRLATQIGSGLAGCLYVLDEPSIGLHQRDNDRLIQTLFRLRDLGNSVIVVEHDEDTIRAADHVLDLGPGAGVRGGQLVAQGTLEEVMQVEQSLTAQYLSGRASIPVPKTRRKPQTHRASIDAKHVPPGWISVLGASENNLRNLDAHFPLGCLTCVTGVSGSGKSTLVDDILRRALFRHFYRAKDRPGKHERILGLEQVDKAIVIDQTPIGRTPRLNPVTYTGSFGSIRELFAGLPGSRVRGYDAGRFSFNVKGGRCETCEGDGMKKIEMHFLTDVYVECEVCHGQRYNRETLEITYKGKNIADVLAMTVDEAARFFRNVPQISDKLIALEDVGLGYVKLGQSGTTLSGGEAQRIKLAAELAKKATGRTVYILDEPTTGLHFADIHKLLEVLMKLRDSGNTLIIIEHNLEVIKCADWVIDLGPEGGAGGGQIVAEGTPEMVAAHEGSHTGSFLRRMLK